MDQRRLHRSQITDSSNWGSSTIVILTCFQSANVFVLALRLVTLDDNGGDRTASGGVLLHGVKALCYRSVLVVN